MIGSVIREFLPAKHILTYLDAILRVYNRFGRRDNKYKARIKILVKAMTADGFAAKVEEEWSHLKTARPPCRMASRPHGREFFTAPAYETLNADDPAFTAKLANRRPLPAGWRATP